MNNDIVMVYKTNDKYQEIEGLISFLESSGVKAVRSPHSVVGSALDLVNGTCVFVNKHCNGIIGGNGKGLFLPNRRMSATPSDLGAICLPDTTLSKALFDLLRSPGALVTTAVAVHHRRELGSRVGLESFVEDRTDLTFDVGAPESAQKVVDGKQGSTEFFHGSGHRDILLLLMLKFFTTKGKLLISMFQRGTY